CCGVAAGREVFSRWAGAVCRDSGAVVLGFDLMGWFRFGEVLVRSVSCPRNTLLGVFPFLFSAFWGEAGVACLPFAVRSGRLLVVLAAGAVVLALLPALLSTVGR